MTAALGIRWDDPRRALGVLLCVLLAAGLLIQAGGTRASAATERMVSVIVRRAAGDGVAEGAVRSLGGAVERDLGIIDSFEAEVPASSLAELRASEGVGSVSLNAAVELHDAPGRSSGTSEGNSLRSVARAVNADYLWHKGFRGDGVDVALIDSGVVPVPGLTSTDKVVNGADLSFESQAPTLRYLDTYGHGTHLAGIIAGEPSGERDGFTGVAPGARLLNVKVAAESGATDVSQVIAAIDWVVQHRRDRDLDVRVINLAFGTDGVQDHRLDPLAHAAEVAWRRGIVVVVSAGNAGFGSAKLNNPAYDPYVLAVGASDTQGTATTSDDDVPDWSSRGDGTRNPDLIAPGRSIVSLRDPGSHVDVNHPEARVGERFFKGSGTSQSAAVVSGAAALLLDQRPELTPDQVKALLTSTAAPLEGSDARAQGAGMVDLKAAAKADTPVGEQSWPVSTGTGSLEAARGSAHVLMDGVELAGEQDIFGETWDGRTWARSSWSGKSWNGGEWNRSSWSGDDWSGGSWAGEAWAATTWTRSSWSRSSWSSDEWERSSWSRSSWSRGSWSRSSWSRSSWSRSSWSRSSWSRSSWSSAGWGDLQEPSGLWE